jgi:predicted amidohydrolase
LMGETISRFSSCFVFYANRSGLEEGVSFAGGSFIFNPAGKLLAKAKYAEDDFLVCDINL